MTRPKLISRIHFLPFLLISISILTLLKLTNVYIGLSSLSAQNVSGRFFNPDNKAANEAPISVLTQEKNDLGHDVEDNGVNQINAIEGETTNRAIINQEAAIFVNDTSNNVVQDRLLQRLSERRMKLEEREAVLQTREALIKAAEFQLDEKITLLEEREQKLLALEKKRDDAQSEELQSLISAYERMKPREAARIFEILDDELLISVSSQMRTQALSGVLAQMSPERARELTQLIASRNEKPVTNIKTGSVNKFNSVSSVNEKTLETNEGTVAAINPEVNLTGNQRSEPVGNRAPSVQEEL